MQVYQKRIEHDYLLCNAYCSSVPESLKIAFIAEVVSILFFTFVVEDFRIRNCPAVDIGKSRREFLNSQLPCYRVV